LHVLGERAPVRGGRGPGCRLADAEREEEELEACFQTLVTGLAVRYYKAVAG